MSFTVSYAQNREDYIIDGFFPDVEKGFYVDVGAYDPDRDSVTKLFYQKGWHGINVEPLKEQYGLLEQKRKKDINLNIGLSSKPGKLTFREYKGGGLSTFSKEVRAEHEQNLTDNVVDYVDRQVKVDTLKNILDEYKVKHIHFMKIDAEGYEYEIIEGGDWKKYRPELICIEANHVKHDWHPILTDNKYRLVFNDGLNEYYLREESLHRKDMFSYPEKMLTGPQLIKWTVQEEIDAIAKNYENGIESLKKGLEQQNNTVLFLTKENQILREKYQDSLRLTKLLKNLLKQGAKRVRKQGERRQHEK